MVGPPRTIDLMRGLRKLLLLSFTLLTGCANHPPKIAEEAYWKDDDTKGIPEPKFDEPSLIWTTAERSSSDQLLELLDLDRDIRKLTGNPTQAKNINCLDEVPNSSWFTNRHGLPSTHLDRASLKVGPGLTPGPDTSGTWLVFRPKVGGTSRGFWIEDSRGDQYIIKFDPPESPELATAAGTIGSKYFHACGYNVPQESIVYWRPEQLRIKDGATIKGKDGKKRPLTMDDINTILATAYRRPDGSYRSLASLNIGNVKGPFMYVGRKKSDPNDWCPHEHRRELRGLYVIGSLVNHYDLKDHNTMDAYIGKDGSGYLKHYLMDFNSTLGSDGLYAKVPRKGYANLVDLRDIGVSTLSLGLKSWRWQDALPAKYPSIGYFESELFEPSKFDPIYPNPAFEQLTPQDAYWGAKIVMAFSDDDLRALVETGEYSDPEAADYLLKTLIERRDKIGRHWFSKVNPLDYPIALRTGESVRLTFEDLAIKYHLTPQGATYQYDLRTNGKPIGSLTEITNREILIPLEDFRSAERQGYSVIEVRIRTQREGSAWSQPVIFLLKYDQAADRPLIVGIEHPS